ncbi:MAG: hypothetical protein QXZ62_05605 [Candidatus Caldarchaeum sp.]
MREKILVVGVFPTAFMSRCKSLCNPAHIAGLWNPYDQLKEYPDDFLEEFGRVEAVVKALAAKGFEVRLVHALSPLGVWLSFRHRLGRGFYAIANKKPVKIGRNIDETLEDIKAAALNCVVRRLWFKIG